jgi:hypothetical protein
MRSYGGRGGVGWSAGEFLLTGLSANFAFTGFCELRTGVLKELLRESSTWGAPSVTEPPVSPLLKPSLPQPDGSVPGCHVPFYELLH